MGACIQSLETVRGAERLTPRRQPARPAAAWLWPILCCAALLAAILLASPFNQYGFDDDWSYGRVAWKLAQTGKLQYNGWGSPLLLFQAFWAFPWIRLFGFSFPVLDASTIPIAMGFALLVYATGRAMGMARELAAFASIGAVTGPLFLPFAASFMTEAYGCFFSMACIYCALRAVQAAGPRGAAAWMWALTLAGLAGGANQQIVWAAPLTIIPPIFFERGRERTVRIQAIAAYGALGIAILAVLHFFSQPYAPMQLEKSFLAWLVVHKTGGAAMLILRFWFVTLLMAVPAFCAFLPWIRWRPIARSAALFAILVVLTGAGILYGWPVAPYGNNIVSVNGISIGQQEAYGAGFVVLPTWLRLLLTLIVNACALAAGTAVVRGMRRRLARRDRLVLGVFGSFLAGYLLLLYPGALIGVAFDRYMLPLAPLLFLVLMLYLSRRQSRIPVVAWGCLALFAAYAIAATHDYRAGLTARTAAARAIERAGVSRNRISAGFEHDGWTQLESADSIRGSEYQDLLAENSSKGFWVEFWDHATGIKPDFVVLNWNRPEPPHGAELAVEFHAWLPPFRRAVVAWKRPDLTAELEAARLIAATPRWR